ncbi:MAG: hypothetical protein GY737_10110 [Desulfobacteraceae bacterium]|nr:hypothetical protein [Desulfobacteraceae bacterium]
MAQSTYSENDLKSISDNPAEKEIDFDQIDELVISTKDIYKCLLKGSLKQTHKLPHCNIVLSRLEALNTKNADFGYIDFKDSFVVDTEFVKTSFDYGAIINCRFTKTKFINSHFKNVSITGTKFFDTIFLDCDLSNMVIESCEFYNCEFVNCITSNKLIEFSFVYKSVFEKTDIQIETIIHNFGIEQGNIINSEIRNDLKKADYKTINIEELCKTYRANNIFSEIEKFRINYFIDPDVLISGSYDLDNTFEPQNWIKLCQIPITLTNLLESYYTFISKHYEQNNSIFLLLLKFHDLTNKLSHEFKNVPEIYHKTIGIHMALSKYVEAFLLLTIKTVEYSNKPLVLLVNGPIEKDYYLKKLNYVFTNHDIDIVKIKKHNSPNELFINWGQYKDIIPLIALIYATRIKVELSRISTNKEVFKKIDIESGLLTEGKEDSEEKQIKRLTFELGPDQDRKELFGLRLKTIFPGNLLFDIGLHLNTTLLSSSRKIILSILEKD